MNRYLPLIMLVAVMWSGAQASAEESDVLAIVEANFQAADSDGNGALDADEFPALIDANAESDIGRSRMVKRFGAYERAFNTADKNGDGSIAWSEILSNRPD